MLTDYKLSKKKKSLFFLIPHLSEFSSKPESNGVNWIEKLQLMSDLIN
jgi:hypothetical protein